MIACPAILDLAVIFWPSVRLAELLGSFDHLLHGSQPGCALVPVVEHVPRSEPTPTAGRRRCMQDPTFDETHDIGASDIEQVGCLLRSDLTIGTDHVHRRARCQARQQSLHGSIRFGREYCNLIADLDADRQVVEVERGNDGTLPSVEAEGLGVPVHAASIGDGQASAISDFQVVRTVERCRAGSLLAKPPIHSVPHLTGLRDVDETLLHKLTHRNANVLLTSHPEQPPVR